MSLDLYVTKLSKLLTRKSPELKGLEGAPHNNLPSRRAKHPEGNKGISPIIPFADVSYSRSGTGIKIHQSLAEPLPCLVHEALCRNALAERLAFQLSHFMTTEKTHLQ
jgi:hypothetical protein